MPPFSSIWYDGILQTSDNCIEGLLLIMALNAILFNSMNFVSALARLKEATAPIDRGDIPQTISNVTSCLNNL